MNKKLVSYYDECCNILRLIIYIEKLYGLDIDCKDDDIYITRTNVSSVLSGTQDIIIDEELSFNVVGIAKDCLLIGPTSGDFFVERIEFGYEGRENRCEIILATANFFFDNIENRILNKNNKYREMLKFVMSDLLI